MEADAADAAQDTIALLADTTGTARVAAAVKARLADRDEGVREAARLLLERIASGPAPRAKRGRKKGGK